VNDIEDLRDAMHQPPDFQPQPLDLALVMHAGGRMRRRRRAAVGATSGLAVLALLVGGAQLLPESSGQPVGGPALPVAGPAVSVPAEVPTPTQSAESPMLGRALGAVVDTGLQADGQDRILWMERLTEQAPAGISIGMVAGRRGPGGELIKDVVTNETEGSDRSPGFHGLEMAMTVSGGETPAFGYYAGPAAKITVVADGRTVRAQQAVWSEDPSIVLFWFPLNQVKPTSDVGRATAYDRNGRKLAAGHPTFAVG
jgi:hypothetical protein